MNGDTELLCPTMIKIPTNTNMIIIGASHHAFLSFKKSHVSLSNDLFFPMLLNYFSLVFIIFDFLINSSANFFPTISFDFSE